MGNQRTLFSLMLSTKMFVLLGEASFAFYLLHHVMMGWPDQGPTDSLKVWLQRALVLFVVISCTAVGALFIIERPSRTALRRALDRRPRRPSASSAGPVLDTAPLGGVPVSAPLAATAVDVAVPGGAPDPART